MADVSVWWWTGGGLLVLVLVALAARWLWLLGRAVHVERCRELFLVVEGCLTIELSDGLHWLWNLGMQ